MYPEVVTAIEAWQQTPDLHRLDHPRLFDDNGHLKSGSRWTQQHVDAFRIVTVQNVPLDDLFAFSLPALDEPVMQQCQLFWRLTRDDLYHQNADALSNIGIPMTMFIRIGACMEALMGVIDRRRSHDSDLSHTSNENEDETESATNSLARTICRTFLHLTNLHHKRPPSWDYVARHEYMPIRILRSSEGSVKNDGAIVYISEQRKKTVHIWVEAKPYEYSPERPLRYESTIPQKVAESLSLAQNQPTVRDVFGIEFSHRYAAFWSVHFTDDYILQSKNNPILDPTHPMIMKRSRVFDLVEQHDRCEFAQAFVGLLRYKSSV